MSSVTRHLAVVSSVVLALAAGGCKGTDPPTAPTVIGSVSNAWPGSLPNRTSSGHPVCLAALPATAVCLNGITATPLAICQDSRYSCGTDAVACDTHGGVYCWRN